MKSLNDNIIVKFTCAYSGLFIWLYPVIFILSLLQVIISYSIEGGISASADYFGLFSGNEALFLPIKISLGKALAVVSANMMVFVVFYLAILSLNKFLVNIFKGEPFKAENGRHLRQIGLITVFLTIFISIMNALFRTSVSGMSDNMNVLIKLSSVLSVFFSPYLMLGLLAVVLGELFLRSAAMKEEIDLTV